MPLELNIKIMIARKKHMERRTKLQILVRPAGREETRPKNIKKNEQLKQQPEVGTLLTWARLKSRTESSGAEAL